MSNLPLRFRSLIQGVGCRSGNSFGDFVGVHGNLINNVLNGRNKPGFELLMRIAQKTGVNTNWLLTGDGPMFQGEGPKETAAPYVLPASVTVDSSGRENVMWIPVRAQAGYVEGYDSPEFLQEQVAFHAPFLARQGVRVFEVGGDSMLPRIHSGDSVWCTQTLQADEVRNGAIYVVITRDALYVKRPLWNRGERYLHLHSDNPLYKPFRVDLNDVQQLWQVQALFTQNLDIATSLEGRVDDLERRVHHLEGMQPETHHSSGRKGLGM